MAASAVKSYFLVHEVVALTGFTKHMLDYLVREDIFPPSGGGIEGRGVRRKYAYADVVLLRALNEICGSKGKIRHLKDALLSFRLALGPIRPGLRLRQHLVVQGNELCLYTPEEGARELRTGQMTLAFVVDLAAVSESVANSVVVDRSGLFRLTDSAAAEAERGRRQTWNQIRTWREGRQAA